MNNIHVTWLGHACFSLEANGQKIVIDPYDDNMEGYAPLRVSAHAVYCSHGHHDHCFTEGVELVQTKEPAVFSVREVSSFHDENGGSKRGNNTIFVIEALGKRLVHLGDLGHILSPEQVAQIGPCDLLMIPVGGFYTIDAAVAMQVLRQLSPTVTIPMHYRFDVRGPAVIAEVEDFTRLAGNTALRHYKTNQFVLADDTDHQIAVLSYLQ